MNRRSQSMLCSLIGLLLAGALLGCQKGDDGKDFLSLTWAFPPLSGTFPSLPNTIQQGVGYPIPANATYSFNYIAWDGSAWGGSFNADQNKGKEGFLVQGDKGSDIRYVVFLCECGPSLSASSIKVQVEQRGGSGEIVLPGSPDTVANANAPVDAVEPGAAGVRQEDLNLGQWTLHMASKRLAR